MSRFQLHVYFESRIIFFRNCYFITNRLKLSFAGKHSGMVFTYQFKNGTVIDWLVGCCLTSSEQYISCIHDENKLQTLNRVSNKRLTFSFIQSEPDLPIQLGHLKPRASKSRGLRPIIVEQELHYNRMKLTHVLRKGRQFLLHICHQSCYS